MTLQWVSADLKTGRVLADLPGLLADWPLTRTLSNSDAVTAHLQLLQAPENWVRATQPASALLACYDDKQAADGTTPKAVEWAGYVSLRHRDGDQDVIDLTLTTLEGYLDRRFVGDMTVTAGMGWRTTVATLVNTYIKTGALPGIDNLQLSYTPGGASSAIDIVWQNTDNATVLARINELIGQFGGEFTVNWAWSADGQSLIPTLVFGDRIGAVTPDGLAPAVAFDLPGSVSALTMDEDYSANGEAGNVVTAYSSGQGTFTPYSTPQQATDFRGAPAFELRISPVASETDTGRLAAFARQKLVTAAPGSQPIAMTYARENDAYRRYGVDWQLGDDVGAVVGDGVLAFPDGLSQTLRVVGVAVTDVDVTPVLVRPETYGG